MSFRFAAARSSATPLVRGRTLLPRMVERVANDTAEGEFHAATLRAALEHFARMGLGAATDARHRARSAHYRGDRQAALHWQEICRALDHRMGTALAMNLARRG